MNGLQIEKQDLLDPSQYWHHALYPVLDIALKYWPWPSRSGGHKGLASLREVDSVSCGRACLPMANPSSEVSLKICIWEGSQVSIQLP